MKRGLFRALVVGAGSIGSRRARLLQENEKIYDLIVTDSVYEHAHMCAGTPVPIEKLDRAPVPDVVFICTPPEGRAEVIRSVLKSMEPYSPKGVFIEKPLAVSHKGLSEIMEIEGLRRTTTMVACNMRFADPYMDLIPSISLEVTVGVFVMRQHESLWSPTHQPINLILDSIHELDLARCCFGEVVDYRGVSGLDGTMVSLWHKSGDMSVIRMDRNTYPPQRHIRLYYKDGRTTVHFARTGDEMYRREMDAFLLAVEMGADRAPNDLAFATNTTRLALNIAEIKL